MNRLYSLKFLPAIIACSVGIGWLGENSLANTVVVATAVGSIFSGFFLNGSVRRQKRVALDTNGQLIVALVFAALMYAMFFVWTTPLETSPGQLSAIGQMGALYCLGLAVMRPWLRRPLGGDVATAMILFSCWLFLGLGTRVNVYLAAAVPGILLILWGAGARAEGARNGGRTKASSRRPVAGVLMLLLTGIVCGLFVWAIPRAYAVAEAQFLSRFSLSASGFGPVMQLGAVNRMYQSGKVVMRVFGGQHAKYLRGVVYNTYRGRYWTLSIPRDNHDISETANASVTSELPITVKLANDDAGHRVFVPLNLGRIHARAPLQIDAVGLVTLKSSDETLNDYSIELLRENQSLRVLPPTPDDRDVPEAMGPMLDRWLKQHVQADSGENLNSAQKLAVIQRTLQQKYRYSLAFERAPNIDALTDFLTRNPEGHCEYFAAAFALLARRVGVPSRVVGGYLLKEFNTPGNYYVVREKYAHAWVEIWMNGKWHSVDPTPPAARSSSGTMITDVMDYLWVWLIRLKDKVLQMTPATVAAVIAGLVLLWGVILFRRRRKKATDAKEAPLQYRDVHDLFVKLESRMASVMPRKKSETIEDWASRLRDSHDGDDALGAALNDVAVVLADYAAWRYGKIGDVTEIASRAQQLKFPQL